MSFVLPLHLQHEWAHLSVLEAIGDPARAVQIMTALFLVLIGSVLWLLRSPFRSDVHKLPSINPVPWFRSSTEAKRAFLTSSTRLFARARVLFPNTPYRMLTDLGDVLDFHGRIPGFEAMTQFGGPLLRNVARKQLNKYLWKLTEPLSEEGSHAISTNFGESSGKKLIASVHEVFKQKFPRLTGSEEWSELTLKPQILDVVARMSSRVFMGNQLCRDPHWLTITKGYTVNLFFAATKLRVYPRSLRPLVHWFLPECRNIREQYRAAHSVIEPVLAKRRRIRQQVTQAGKPAPYFDDALDWADEEAERLGVEYNHEAFQLMLSMAAIHTTTDLLVQVMLDLAQHPELLPIVRGEIVRVLKEDGWGKNALDRLVTLDSLIKESQRLKPVSMAAMRRLATASITLSTGLTIPKGTRTFVDSYPMRDSTVYTDPETWDPERFLRLRSQPGKERSSLLVNTSADHLGFGHGIFACPGRFFAANEMKVALCHILIKYEWELAEGTDVRPLVLGAATMANPGARIRIRKRSDPEIDLDTL
ncbi:cytochrome P450 [Aspergillus carlsbadensis]|nr:cytochrome P450 [Aspergillus carlsbadensis]